MIPEFPGVPGRMERVQISSDQEISVIVDYAHTPDSLENLLKAARPFIPGKPVYTRESDLRVWLWWRSRSHQAPKNG